MPGPHAQWSRRGRHRAFRRRDRRSLLLPPGRSGSPGRAVAAVSGVRAGSRAQGLVDQGRTTPDGANHNARTEGRARCRPPAGRKRIAHPGADVEQFLDRIAQAQLPSVITAYENRSAGSKSGRSSSTKGSPIVAVRCAASTRHLELRSTSWQTLAISGLALSTRKPY